jgi:beta-alanine degradation protein BauB
MIRTCIAGGTGFPLADKRGTRLCGDHAQTKGWIGWKEAAMVSARSEVQVDTPEVRVTEWRLAPGSATGHHIHEMDYVIVPVTAGEMTIVAPDGDRSKAQLSVGRSYFRKAGVEHDVLNETAAEIVFLEVELKP